MSHVTRLQVDITTAADGSATVYSGAVTGKLSAIHYVKGDFADGVDFTVTSEATGETIWAETNVNASAVRAVRRLVYTSTGSSIAYAATFGVYEPIALANDRFKVVIAQGGDTKAGVLHFVVD